MKRSRVKKISIRFGKNLSSLASKSIGLLAIFESLSEIIYLLCEEKLLKCL